MSEPTSINSHIIEGLYCEALTLADEVRARFAPASTIGGDTTFSGQDDDLTRIARSCEGLRTTTRIMHAVAWLLNQRSYLMGELSELHLRRHARLSEDLRGPDPENLELLEPEARTLVDDVLRLYARLLRLDREWRQGLPRTPSAIEALREQLQMSAVVSK